MMQRIRVMTATILLLISVAGCGAEDTVYLERAVPETEQISEDGEEAANTADSAGLSEKESGVAATGSEDADGVQLAGQKGTDGTQAAEKCYVYVCGAVKMPGVYILAPGARIYEAIEQAGGLTENAGIVAVNQAQEVYDGLMIYIPTKEEAAAYPVASMQETDSQGEDETDDRVNLNTASETELMTLSGIGQTRAEAILAYRKVHGSFSSVEEIMNVDGIKEGLYNRIKDNIKVK